MDTPLPATLDAALDDAWRHLLLGVDDRRHGFHLPVIATIDDAGDADARTVVLRRADRDRHRIAFHSDLRSPKATHLATRPRAMWVFYDPAGRVQVRASGPTEVLEVGVAPDATAAWDRTNVNARRCYLGPHAPSSASPEVSTNLPLEWVQRNPTLEESAPGAANFCLIATTITSLDWLVLRHDGHHRARFEWDDDGMMQATWRMP